MQSDDVGGGGGLFAYYPTTGGLIRDSAHEIATHTGGLATLRRQLDGEHRRVLAGVDGDLYAPISAAPELATANLTRLEQSACFASGMLRLFADAVDDYNHYATSPRSIEALNAAYTDARLANFGLNTDAYAKGGAKADRGYDTDRTSAEADLLVTLTAEYQRLGEWLDLRADQAARMLDRGPNPGDVTALWAAGALPPNATEVWPGLDLVEVPQLRLPYELRDNPDDRRTLHDLTQDELLALWNEHEYEPARELLADQIVHDFENHTALREFNLSINLAYMAAMARGMPESFARKLAQADPDTLFDLLAPLTNAYKTTYRVAVGDLVDAIRHDPWSLRTLGELAMATPVGRLGKLRKVDDLLRTVRKGESAIEDAANATRIAARRADGFLPKIKHQPGSPGSYNKFAQNLDISGAIRDALKSSDARFMENQLPDSFRVVTDLGYVVGSRGETALRVIVSGDGRILNAFPVKVQ